MQIAGTSLETALRNAISGGYVAEMSGQTYTVTQPIVINVMTQIQGPLGIDLGGATIMSQVTNGQPVIRCPASRSEQFSSSAMSCRLLPPVFPDRAATHHVRRLPNGHRRFDGDGARSHEIGDNAVCPDGSTPTPTGITLR